MNYWERTWAEFKNGSDHAFEKIYFQYVDVLFRYGIKVCNNREEVKDCIQQLFLELFASRERLSTPDNPERYLLKSLKRILIQRMNKEQCLEYVDSYALNVFDIELDTENKLVVGEQDEQKVNLLNNALMKLSPKKKELLFLKFYSGLDNHQIASIVGEKPETIQKQIYRILKKLQVNYVDRFVELFVLCFKT